MAVTSEDPQEAPATAAKRKRSGIRFPYYDLEGAIKVARAVRDKGGGQCSLDQLARFVNAKGTDSGAFRSLVAAAATFGLVTASAGNVAVADRAAKILSPVYEDDERQGRIEAFYSVPLFKAVYDHYRGQQLPAEPGMKNALQHQFGVVKARVPTAYRVLMDSAEQAGFFATGRTHLVEPPAKGQARLPDEQKPPQEELGGGGGGSDGGGAGLTGLHPAIAGLLRELPSPGSPWPKARKDTFKSAFGIILDVVYPTQEGGESSQQ
jgi:hypothetical protein